MSLSLLTITTLTVLATLAIHRLVTLNRLEEVGAQLVSAPSPSPASTHTSSSSGTFSTKSASTGPESPASPAAATLALLIAAAASSRPRRARAPSERRCWRRRLDGHGTWKRRTTGRRSLSLLAPPDQGLATRAPAPPGSRRPRAHVEVRLPQGFGGTSSFFLCECTVVSFGKPAAPERIRHTPLVAAKYNRQNITENPLEITRGN